MSVIIARQPIYDDKLNVFAYELLYRSGEAGNFYQGQDATESTKTVVLNTFIEIGIDKLTNGKYGFINFTEDLLKGDYIYFLPKKYLGVEILETVPCTDENLQACRELKNAGFLIVMDDFIYAEENISFIEVADIVKMDFLSTDDKILQSAPKLHKKKMFLAEKIETEERFNLAKNWGYKYFQGYYFNKPTIITQKEVKPVYVNIAKILGKMNEYDFDVAEIAKVVEFDPAISYKLLKYANSVAFGGYKEATKINVAIARIGINEMRMFIMLLLSQCVAERKPVELVRQSIIRAKLCEQLAFKLKRANESQIFSMIGLYSLMDVMLEMPMEEVLENINVSAVIKDAILGLNDENARETPYLNALRLAAEYDNGEFDRMAGLLAKLNVTNYEFFDISVKAIKWCDDLLDFTQ